MAVFADKEVIIFGFKAATGRMVTFEGLCWNFDVHCMKFKISGVPEAILVNADESEILCMYNGCMSEPEKRVYREVYTRLRALVANAKPHYNEPVQPAWKEVVIA